MTILTHLELHAPWHRDCTLLCHCECDCAIDRSGVSLSHDRPCLLVQTVTCFGVIERRVQPLHDGFVYPRHRGDPLVEREMRSPLRKRENEVGIVVEESRVDASGRAHRIILCADGKRWHSDLPCYETRVGVPRVLVVRAHAAKHTPGVAREFDRLRRVSECAKQKNREKNTRGHTCYCWVQGAYFLSVNAGMQSSHTRIAVACKRWRRIRSRTCAPQTLVST